MGIERCRQLHNRLLKKLKMNIIGFSNEIMLLYVKRMFQDLELKMF